MTRDYYKFLIMKGERTKTLFGGAVCTNKTVRKTDKAVTQAIEKVQLNRRLENLPRLQCSSYVSGQGRSRLCELCKLGDRHKRKEYERALEMAKVIPNPFLKQAENPCQESTRC